MSLYEVRLLGDPALRQRAAEVADIDGRVARTAASMIPVMYEANGLGLAAPQVGISQRLFVYDLQDGTGSHTIVNPEIVESAGEWVFAESCLSMPGIAFELVRPKQVHVVGRGLDCNEVSIEADELAARLFQHELDHLDGVLVIDHLERRDRKAAVREWHRRRAGLAA